MKRDCSAINIKLKQGVKREDEVRLSEEYCDLLIQLEMFDQVVGFTTEKLKRQPKYEKMIEFKAQAL